MNILGYLQKIGRALMVPVAVLPAAAVLMGIGYYIDPNGWGGESAIAAFLIKAGAAIIDNMSWLFAVGVAYGMSKDKDGAAALAGLVGMYVVTTLCSLGAVTQIGLIDVTAGGDEHAAKIIAGAFGRIQNQFIGILVGVMAAEIYNRFYQVELHKALAFFSGKRLVPILVSVAATVLSVVLMYVWPVIFKGLFAFGQSITDLGSVGAGVYGFFNRLLIPVGLHHALNAVFWFDLAGINDLGNFWAGGTVVDAAKAVAEHASNTDLVAAINETCKDVNPCTVKLSADGTTLLGRVGQMGQYMGGFFPVMMFGLPGAALAIYHTAKPENKEKVLSIMLAAGVATFFTGVTEPLEFAFMFVAPVLYVIHAALTGLSLFIASSMEWTAGFGFSAGLVDMLLSAKKPESNLWYMLIAQGAVFFALYYVIFVAVIKALNLKTPGREDDAAAAPSAAAGSTDKAELAAKYLAALGGKDNLEVIDACITRLRLTLKDRSLIDEAQIKALGAMGIVKLGEQNLQVILGPQAELVAGEMKKL